MRIGICCLPSFGGSGVVASELALALAEGGDVVHVVSSDRPPRLSERANVHFHRVDGSEIQEYGLFDRPLQTLALANRLAEVAASARLDVLHAHYAAPHAVAALLARRLLAEGVGDRPPCPIVTTVHGTDVTLVGARPSYRDIVGWALRSSDRVTAPSEALAREATERFSLDEPVDVIPNFVPPAAAGRRREPASAAESGLVVHVSNFRPVKRAADVIAAFALVLREIPARLCMVGDGPERAGAERRCRELGIGDHVTFLGNQTHVEPILEQGDLFLSASESESFGLASLEALALGVPVVATRTGGVPEVVCENRNGLLCPVGDVEALAASCVALLRDPARRQAFAAHGRKWARSRFDRRRIVARYRELYRATLTIGRAAASEDSPLLEKVEA
ncbi:MAG: N-acetyl-alpha-D-glucosaminyl L-malate synthase BshA [Acidobacteria bacterium]|nr:N-acetyl-alpha-D-glucosaminyl L-malate synthase BshA [Acidobacteriota bacterium]